MQKLVDLVRRDVDQDAAEPPGSKNQPGRIARLRRCGPRPTVCTTVPIAPSADEPRGDLVDGTTKRSEKQIEKIRPGLPRRRLHGAQLVEGRDARLVHHHVLAAAHRVDRERRPAVRHRGRADEVDRRVVEQRLRVVDGDEIRKALAEALQHAGIGGLAAIEAGADRAGLDQAADEVIDVAVVEADRSEAHEVTSPCGRRSPGPTAGRRRRAARASSGTSVGRSAISLS